MYVAGYDSGQLCLPEMWGKVIKAAYLPHWVLKDAKVLQNKNVDVLCRLKWAGVNDH